MQQIGRHRLVPTRSPAIERYLLDSQSFERQAGPAVALLARDAFVAETSVKLDALVRDMQAVRREFGLLQSDVAELTDEAVRGNRLSEFLDREHKYRAAKLEDLERRFSYLKSRFDTIDGNSKGDYHAFRNFEAISRRLTELGEIERTFRDVTWKLKLSAGLFIGSVLVWVAILALA